MNLSMIKISPGLFQPYPISLGEIRTRTGKHSQCCKSLLSQMKGSGKKNIKCSEYVTRQFDPDKMIFRRVALAQSKRKYFPVMGNDFLVKHLSHCDI